MLKEKKKEKEKKKKKRDSKEFLRRVGVVCVFSSVAVECEMPPTIIEIERESIGKS